MIRRQTDNLGTRTEARQIFCREPRNRNHEWALKQELQSVLRSLCTAVFVSLTRWNTNQCYSLRTANLIFEAFWVLFPVVFLILPLWIHFIKWCQKERSIQKLSSCWHKMFYSPHASSCEMSQNTHESKKRKHMLDSAQYGLEIIFKLLNGQGKKKIKKGNLPSSSVESSRRHIKAKRINASLKFK